MGYVVENDVVPRGSAANTTAGTYATGTDLGAQGTTTGAGIAQPVIVTGSAADVVPGTAVPVVPVQGTTGLTNTSGTYAPTQPGMTGTTGTTGTGITQPGMTGTGASYGAQPGLGGGIGGVGSGSFRSDSSDPNPGATGLSGSAGAYLAAQQNPPVAGTTTSHMGTQPGVIGGDSIHTSTHQSTDYHSSEQHTDQQKKGWKEKAADKVDHIMPKLDEHKAGRDGKADGVIDKVQHGLGKVHDKLTPGTNNSPHLPGTNTGHR